MNNSIYLDYAAATPVSDSVLRAMMPYMSDFFYNPSSPYLAAQKVERAIEESRRKVAQIIGATPREIYFTAGGTESCNLAIHGVLKNIDDGHIVTTAVEHEAVLEPVKQYAHSVVKTNNLGQVSVDAVRNAITNNTCLVSVMLVNNEIGTIQQLSQMAELIKMVREERVLSGNRMPLFLHTDACQAALYLDLHVSRLGVDLMTLNGGKMYGPKQSGVLYAQADISLYPIILGGGQERGARSGTENVPAIIGFTTALEEAQKYRREESERLVLLRQWFVKALRSALPAAQVNGHLKQRVPNNINILLPGIDGERFVMELDEQGVQLATGSACSASSDEPSHVLRALGLSNASASSSLRITMGRQTQKKDLESAFSKIVATYHNMT